jgi:hypothetical protein
MRECLLSLADAHAMGEQQHRGLEASALIPSGLDGGGHDAVHREKTGGWLSLYGVFHRFQKVGADPKG